MGYHTANKQELTDDQLPWASVMYPVTAGNGGAGTWSNAALRQGSFVFGFFLDGEDAQQPVIMGVIGFNEYTALSNRDNDDVAFFPFSGYTLNDTVARYSTATTKEPPKGTQVNSKSPASNNGVQESVAGHEKKTGADKEQYDEGRKKNPVASPSTCEAVPLGKIQIEIKNMIAEVEKIKKTASNWEAKVSKKVLKMKQQKRELAKLVNVKEKKKKEKEVLIPLQLRRKTKVKGGKKIKVKAGLSREEKLQAVQKADPDYNAVFRQFAPPAKQD